MWLMLMTTHVIDVENANDEACCWRRDDDDDVAEHDFFWFCHSDDLFWLCHWFAECDKFLVGGTVVRYCLLHPAKEYKKASAASTLLRSEGKGSFKSIDKTHDSSTEPQRSHKKLFFRSYWFSNASNSLVFTVFSASHVSRRWKTNHAPISSKRYGQTNCNKLFATGQPFFGECCHLWQRFFALARGEMWALELKTWQNPLSQLSRRGMCVRRWAIGYRLCPKCRVDLWLIQSIFGPKIWPNFIVLWFNQFDWPNFRTNSLQPFLRSKFVRRHHKISYPLNSRQVCLSDTRTKNTILKSKRKHIT